MSTEMQWINDSTKLLSMNTCKEVYYSEGETQ